MNQQLMTVLGLDKPATTFESYVDQWLKLADALDEIKTQELLMRKAIAASAFPAPKEGTNNFVMADGRKLKLQHKISRSLEEAMIPQVRAEYELLNHRPVVFDELLKVKYDLAIVEYRKLDDAALVIVSKMVTSKAGAPGLEVV